MRKILIIGLCVGLSACSGGGNNGGSAGSVGFLNPFNWFGNREARQARRSQQAILLPAEATAPADAGPLITQITGLTTERTSTGTIIRATGQLPAIGYHEVTLVPVPTDAAGLLRYEFRALPPAQVSVIATSRMLAVTAAVHLSKTQYGAVRQIEVVAARNSRKIRR